MNLVTMKEQKITIMLMKEENNILTFYILNYSITIYKNCKSIRVMI